MVDFQVISPSEEKNCSYTLGAILDLLDKDLFWELRKDKLPVFEREIKEQKEARSRFKVPIRSLGRFNSYGQYLTSIYLGFSDMPKPIWLKYVESNDEKFVYAFTDDNTFSLHENLKQHELNFLTEEMKKFSTGIAETLRSLDKSYILLGSNALLDSYGVKLKSSN